MGHLNTTTRQVDATVKFDIFSGFRFSDERPPCMAEATDYSLPFVTLMRFLLAYRMSIVKGSPRVEFEPYWEMARELAPNWAGFSQDRCSESALQYVAAWNANYEQFLKDELEMERHLNQDRR